jgi:GntR family transcriptional regulator
VLGTYVTMDEEKLKSIREEMAGTLLDNFIAGMKDLGFKKEEIIKIIEVKYDAKSF